MPFWKLCQIPVNKMQTETMYLQIISCRIPPTMGGLVWSPIQQEINNPHLIFILSFGLEFVPPLRGRRGTSSPSQRERNKCQHWDSYQKKQKIKNKKKQKQKQNIFTLILTKFRLNNSTRNHISH